jgi:predicted amidohydrolase YtcJ
VNGSTESGGLSEHAADITVIDVEVGGRPGCTVHIEEGRIVSVETTVSRFRPRSGPKGTDVVDGAGGALIPGLNDHHIHLFSLAARDHSLLCGPPSVQDRSALAVTLAAAMGDLEQNASPTTWLRGYGYDETVTGPLTADGLDDLLGEQRWRPVRIQHRSGHQWVVNRSGLETLGLDRAMPRAPGVEIGADDRPTGALYDADAVFRRGGPADIPSLAATSERLSRYGVTGVTDATASNGPEELAAIDGAVANGELNQSVHMLGGALPERIGGPVTTGAVKLMLEDRQLPALDALIASIRAAGRRGVALHVVTRESLVLAATALSMAGGGPHRIEHASVAPPEVIELLRPLPVTVVTQPGFIAEHGDRYRRDVDLVDQEWLYRLRAWDRAGIPLAGSTDAPFGSTDPWSAMAAAVTRRTATGHRIGRDERLTPERALNLFLGHPTDPGGSVRTVSVGSPADLCLLDRPWREARTELHHHLVRATIRAGRIAYLAGS